MRIKYHLIVLYFLITCAIIFLSVVSCESENIRETEITDIVEIIELIDSEQEIRVTPILSPVALVSGKEAEMDLIMVSYRDPAQKEGVVTFFRELTGSDAITEVILTNADENCIPAALAFSLSWEESRYNPNAFNRNQNNSVDRGLFQLNSASFPHLELEDFYDPNINASYGLAHLRWCLDMAGTEVAALAMYNAGHNRVRSAGTPKNTLDYVSRIIKRQRNIDEFFREHFTADVIQPLHNEDIGAEIVKKPFRLSLLIPLGR